jgi:hypothetical protein
MDGQTDGWMDGWMLRAEAITQGKIILISGIQ